MPEIVEVQRQDGLSRAKRELDAAILVPIPILSLTPYDSGFSSSDTNNTTTTSRVLPLASQAIPISGSSHNIQNGSSEVHYNNSSNFTKQLSDNSTIASQLKIRAPQHKNGPYSYFKAISKFDVIATLKEAQTKQLPNLVAKVVSGSTISQNTAYGFSASTAASDDSQWLTEIQIGTPPQTLLLNFDTGSSDLWLFSTDLPVAERQNQVLYNPANSSTALAAPSSTWNITYADTSGASGFVGTDTVYLGGLPIKDQAIERATYVSKNFFSNQLASGLLGLAFSAINTVKPNPVITPVENMIRQGLIKNPLFTVTMKDSGSSATGQGGHYTFGYIDTASYKGQIAYATVNTSQGFWQVNSPYFKIGRDGKPLPRNSKATSSNSVLSTRLAQNLPNETVDLFKDLSTTSQGLSVFDSALVAKRVAGMGNATQSLAAAAGGLYNIATPDHQVIIDTGTTLMLIDDMTLLTIYNSVPGATYNASVGGYTLPCSTVSPDTFYMLGESFFGIPGSSLPFAKLDNGMCYGGIQSRGTFPMDIYGDTFIKNNYIVFEQGAVPRIGFAYRRDITFSATRGTS